MIGHTGDSWIAAVKDGMKPVLDTWLTHYARSVSPDSEKPKSVQNDARRKVTLQAPKIGAFAPGSKK
jgi:hypothetical protein